MCLLHRYLIIIVLVSKYYTILYKIEPVNHIVNESKLLASSHIALFDILCLSLLKYL